MRRWGIGIAATLGCLLLAAFSLASAEALISRSCRDLDGANVRMQIFRHQVYDVDFIWAAVAFGTNVVVVAAMFMICAWMFVILVDY